jgi:hypothetical protein
MRREQKPDVQKVRYTLFYMDQDANEFARNLKTLSQKQKNWENTQVNTFMQQHQIFFKAY